MCINEYHDSITGDSNNGWVSLYFKWKNNLMNLTTTAAHYHNFLHSIFKNMLISKKKIANSYQSWSNNEKQQKST